MAENIDNVIKYLKDLNLTKSFKVKVPSLQTEISFKQLNTEQLKQILETITDVSSIVNNFQSVFYKIVKENLIDTNINIEQLTTYDFYYIALQTRINSLSENYTVYFTEDEIENFNLPIQEYNVNLTDVINIKQINNFDNETFFEDQIKVICSPTTIKNEIDFINFFNDKIKILANADMKKIIGEVFIYEIAKSVKTIILNEQEINLYDLTFDKKTDIIKQLPVSITSKIIRYIEKYKQSLYDLYLIQIETNTDNSTVILQKELQYNATLFNY